MLKSVPRVVSGVLIAGCATVPSGYSPGLPPQAIPSVRGSYYQVQPGDTLWRIAHDFGVDLNTLVAVNRIADSTKVKVGQRVFIPTPVSSTRFLWPARGRMSRTGEMAVKSVNPGLEIRAPEGSVVRASRTGRVAVAARQVSGWGTTVILDHEDGYATVYAGLGQLVVTPGGYVEQGNPVGRLGRGPLYFEIRKHASPSDPLRLLP